MVHLKLAISEAMEALINDPKGSFEKATPIIIEYGHELKESGNLVFSHSDVANGIENDIGIYRDRVGYYRLWKNAKSGLMFQHFYKSSESTRGMEVNIPSRYGLSYDPESFEPISFSVEADRNLILPKIFKARIAFYCSRMRVIAGQKVGSYVYDGSFGVKGSF